MMTNLRRWTAQIPIAIALVLAGVASLEAQVNTPRTLAFVVGIEHYDDRELDKIQFAADDARRVYKLLETVTELDPRSVLRVADDDDQSKLSADTVRTELQKFVQMIDNNMNVVVYFGGHGTLSDADTLWYLPSNYSRTSRTGYVAFNEIRTMFVERINGRKPLYKTTLTFLVNMCGAGNAVVPGRTNYSVDSEREEIEAVQKLLSDQKFGLQQYAIIPATQKRVDTFEDQGLKSSVFAHHLLDGLAGAAASKGVVTTGSLFGFLEGKLGTLARHGDFDSDIPLGVTQRIEGLSNYLVGSALLASAQALDGASVERASHRTALLDLAADRLAAVPSSAIDLRTRAMLRSAQVDALRNRRPDPSAVRAFDAPSGVASDVVESAQLKELYTDQGPQGITSQALRQSLQNGAPFYALILDVRQPNRLLDDPAANTWQTVLSSFKGLKAIQPLVITPDLPIPRAMLETIRTWAASEKEPALRPRLIVVSVGVSGVRGADGGQLPFSELASEGAQLYPFGKREIDQVASAWNGPLSIFYLGPFGGVLLNGAPPLHHDISLLLAAKQPNGVTFSGSRFRPGDQGGTAALFARGFKEYDGNIEEYPQIVPFIREQSPNGMSDDWLAGTPAWIPQWGRSTVRPTVEHQLAPLQRFALHVSAGCAAQQLDTCDANSGVPDSFGLLVNAAQADLSNDSDTVPDYSGAAARLRTSAALTLKAPGADNTRAVLKALADTVDRRSAATKKRRTRRVIVLTLGVEDYASPLVADLPNTRKDLDAYGAALKKIFDSAKIATLVRAPRMVEKASDIVDAIRSERTAMNPDDLLMLVYSGRGLDLAGRRYVSAGSAQPCKEIPFVDPPVPCAKRGWSEVVDLWEIAELMRDRSFVAVYDTQFITPIAEGRDDELLDKHLGSGRRGLPDQEERIAAPRIADGILPFEVRDAGPLPSRQLHIWFEGTVTAAGAPRQCGPEKLAVTSPLAAAIIGSMPASASATYREWLEAASIHPCLRGPNTNHDMPRVLVAQGALNLPLMATGDGAEWVDYFRNDTARRETNIRAAAAVVDDEMQRFPNNRNRLSKAAILLAVSVLDRPAPRTALANVGSALSEVGQLLSDVKLDTAEDRKLFRALVYEFSVRRWVLDGDPLRARAHLLTPEVDVLTERNLADRLVALTEEAIRLQPETLVEETSKLLESADASRNSTLAPSAANPLSPARRRLSSMLQNEETRRATKFSIRPL